MKVIATVTVKVEHDDGTISSFSRSRYEKTGTIASAAETASIQAVRDCMAACKGMHGQ